MDNRIRYKGKKGKYLLELASDPTQTIVAICTKAQVSESSYFTWMREDKKFAQQVKEIREASMDVIEQTLSGYSARLANRLVELSEQNEDKRTALAALQEVKKLINKTEVNKEPTKFQLNVEYGE